MTDIQKAIEAQIDAHITARPPDLRGRNDKPLTDEEREAIGATPDTPAPKDPESSE